MSSIGDSPEMARNLNRYVAGSGDLKPVLRGGDLLEMGVPQGPMMGRVLAELRDMRLDRRVTSEEEERQWVKKRLVTSREGGG